MQGPGGAQEWVSFKEAAEYDLVDDGRDYYGGDNLNPNNYFPCHLYSKAGYEAHRNLIFQPDGTTPPHTGTYPELGGGTLPNNVWQVHQVPGIPPMMNLPGPQGQQVQPPAHGPPRDGQKVPAAVAAPHAPLAQQSRAQIAVQPPGGHGGAGAGLAQVAAGTGAQGPPYQEYLGIVIALECLAPVMADADTARNLQWQWEVGGDCRKLLIIVPYICTFGVPD